MKKKIIIWSCIGVAFIAVAVGALFIANSPVSGSVDERMSEAKKLVEADKYTKAENTYKSILKEDAANVDATIALADAYAAQGESDKAIEILKQAVTQNSQSTELIDKTLAVYNASGNVTDAIRFVDGITDADLRYEYYDLIYDRTKPQALSIGNTMGNLANDGLVAFDGETVYYSDIADGKRLYALRNGEKKLLVDGEIESINIVGDYLYFIDRSRDYYIFKVKKDGTDHSRVKKIMATDLMVFGNKMYYINWNEDCKVYCMNIDGTGNEALSTVSTDNIYSYGPWLYFANRSSENELYHIGLDGESEGMVNQIDTMFINGYRDSLYFRNGTDAMNIYRMSLDGTVFAALNNSRSGYVNAVGGYVFFVDFANGGVLCRTNADGSGLVKICNDSCANICIDGDYIYYFNEHDDKRLYRIRKDGSGRELLVR